MFNMFSIYYAERSARDHYADLLAEAEKTRLVREALAHQPPRQASRTRDVQFRPRNILTVLVSDISRILG